MPKWTMLVYRLPAEPSAPRVAVWRALRRIEGAYLQDGVYVVRASEEADAALARVAQSVRERDGEALVIEVGRVDDERGILARLAQGAAEEGGRLRKAVRRPKAP